MGISDRDYMRDSAENSSKRIRPRKKIAKNTPNIIARIKFACWRLLKRR